MRLNQIQAALGSVAKTELVVLIGVFSIGGAVQYSSAQTRGLFKDQKNGANRLEEYDYSNLVVTPSIGYFLSDNLSFNLAVDYLRYESEYEVYENTAYVMYMELYISPFASKPFISAGYLIISGTSKIANSGLFIGAGYNIAIAKNIGLQPMIRYTLYYPEEKNEGDLKAITFGIGVKTFIF